MDTEQQNLEQENTVEETKIEETTVQETRFDAEKALTTLEEALPGRIEKILRGIVKSNGGTEEDFEKTKEELKKNDKSITLQEELENAKNELKNIKFDNAFNSIAKDLNLKEEKLNYVKKLYDYNNDCELDTNKLKNAIEKVVEDFPELLKQKEDKNTKKLNVTLGNSATSEKPEENDFLRKCFGLNK